jgi:hypothetical protein
LKSIQRSAAQVAAILLVAFSVLAFAHDADESGRPPEKLGKVRFPTSCSPSVQPVFERGVALLHSFSYVEALRSFNEVLKREPSCTIAYWGIGATQLVSSLSATSDEALVEARAAVEKGLAAGAKTARERDYIAAISAFYTRDHASPQVRAGRYEAAMEKLAAKYPDDIEASAFYALALIIVVDTGDKTFARQLKGAAILEPLFRAYPDHPGIAHYLIHAYDYPPIALKGLPAALRYAEIAPSASHALHMPSHIFTRVGAWKESIATNARSEAAARKENSNGDILHALDYQIYAALQLARDGYAADALWRLRADAERADSLAGFYAQAAAPARYALERGDWSFAVTLAPLPSQFPFVSALTRYARGYAAARRGNPAAAELEAAELGRLRGELESRGDRYWATEVEVQRLTVLAWTKWAKGEREEGLSDMVKAADLEDSSEKSPTTPGRLLPAREVLGDMLLLVNRPAEALKAYETSALHEPNRFRGYFGAAVAAQRSGDAAKARAYCTRLIELSADGDPRPEVEQAKTYLAGN